MINKIVEEAPKFLSEFYGMPEDKCRENIQKGSELVKKEWLDFNGTFDEFYRVVKNYPFDLAKFNSVYRLEFMNSIFNAILDEKYPLLTSLQYDGKPKLLEFGGGGGELSLVLSERFDVTHVDLPSVTFDYAKFRGERYDLGVRYVNEIPDEKFDIISMQDVYEHLPEPAPVVHSLCDVLKENGVMVSSAWFTNDNHYLHHSTGIDRKYMSVTFANSFCLWLHSIVVSKGIQGEEAESAVGVFRFNERLNKMMAVNEMLVSPECALSDMSDAIEEAGLLHTDEVSKVNFLLAVS